MKAKPNQVRENISINDSSNQHASASPDAIAICTEARRAFVEFNDAACAVVALARFNASHIERLVRGSGARNDFESSVLMNGNHALPRLLADNFAAEFSSWKNAMNQMAERIEAGQVAGMIEPEVEGDVEVFVHTVCHLVRMQNEHLEELIDDGYPCEIIFSDKLNAAFDRAFRAYSALARFVRANNGGTVSKAA